MNDSPQRPLHHPAVLLAFAAVYLIWGSTYLVIKIGIETIPPFLLAGVRFVGAGAMLYGFERLRGASRPTLRQWRSATLIGALLMFGGNGVVTWAQQMVPSGLAALLLATMPVWMVALDATLYRRDSTGPRPNRRTWLGLGLAIVGVGLLAEPGSGAVAPLGALLLLFASFSWANGSLLNRRAELPPSPWLSASMQMIAGGSLLLVSSGVTGEWRDFALADVSGRSIGALFYLALLGSIAAHSAYVYLLRVQSAAAVSTYAFVNPVIALLLGWMFGEAMGARTLLGATLIVGAVLLIHAARHRSESATSPSAPSVPRQPRRRARRVA